MSDPVRATRLDWRRGLQWFGAQFLVVVAGVLVALSLDAWRQGRQEVKSESSYLALLSRDVARSITDLEQFSAFEARLLEDAIAAQRAIAQVPVKGDTAKLSEVLSHLLTRQTMVLKNSTYLDLVSTGHLTLIRDAKLRDEIVDFYQVTGQRFEVINRNNAYFVDNVYNTNVIMSGLIQLRLSSKHPVIARDFATMAEKLGPDFTIPRDRLWSLSADAPEWAMVRSSLMGRMLVSTSAIRVGSERLQAARKLKAAIDAAIAS
jgi:hypothetical protein